VDPPAAAGTAAAAGPPSFDEDDPSVQTGTPLRAMHAFFQNKIVSTLCTSSACFSASCISLDPAINAWYADFAFYLGRLTVGLELLKRACPNNRHFYCMEYVLFRGNSP
jgi:hypothetical protein